MYNKVNNIYIYIYTHTHTYPLLFGFLSNLGHHRNWGELPMLWDSQVALVVKNFPANVRDIRYSCSIPGLGRSPGGGHGDSLQYSCLKNPMDRGTWQTTVHRVAKSQTRWKQLNLHAHPVLYSRLSLVIYSIQAVHMCQWQSPTSSHPTFSLESQMLFLYTSVSMFAL